MPSLHMETLRHGDLLVTQYSVVVLGWALASEFTLLPLPEEGRAESAALIRLPSVFS